MRTPDPEPRIATTNIRSIHKSQLLILPVSIRTVDGTHGRDPAWWNVGRLLTAAGLSGAEDATIWNYAMTNRTIIVTKDEDFAERTARTLTGPVIVWLRIGNATNRNLLAWLEPRWSSVIELLNSNNRLIEVR